MDNHNLTEPAHRLADVLVDIALDLRAGDPEPDHDRLTVAIESHATGKTARMVAELQRLRLQDGDTLAIVGNWHNHTANGLDALRNALHAAHKGKRITCLAIGRDTRLEQLDPAAMAEAGWVRRPEYRRETAEETAIRFGA